MRKTDKTARRTGTRFTGKEQNHPWRGEKRKTHRLFTAPPGYIRAPHIVKRLARSLGFTLPRMWVLHVRSPGMKHHRHLGCIRPQALSEVEGVEVERNTWVRKPRVHRRSGEIQSSNDGTFTPKCRRHDFATTRKTGNVCYSQPRAVTSTTFRRVPTPEDSQFLPSKRDATTGLKEAPCDNAVVVYPIIPGWGRQARDNSCLLDS